MQKKNVTLKDVAQVAGVSTATVARVLHARGYIAEDTKKQVEAAIKQTGYHLNVVAQGLRTQQTQTIGHILHSISPNPFYAEVALGAEQEALTHGWNVLTINVQGSAERERLGVESLLQRRVDAILFTSAVDEANVAMALDAGLAVVQVQRPTSVPSHKVSVDNYVGTVAAMEHLIALGHERIAFIGADPKRDRMEPSFLDQPGYVERERLTGYIDTLQKHHLPVDEAFIALGRYYSLEDDGSTGDGYKFMKQFLQKADQFTAVFASCDILATGALQAIYEYDLKVPTDISVMGFDNTYGSYLTPPLTTVALPMMDIGRSAVRIVLEHHYHKATSPAVETTYQHTRLSTRLIVRASTGAPRTARMAAKE